jgi:hypothetical protein
LKTGLKISLLLNLVLAGGLIYILAGRQRIILQGQPKVALSIAASNQSSSPGGSASALPEPASKGKPFHWSQIEARDYRVYVANLRSIGCPELTIHDIISADVESLYTAKRRALQLTEAGTGPWSRQEETQFIANLLGERSDSEFSKPQTAELSAGTKTKFIASMPLVFQPVDLEKLHLNEGQKEAIEQLRQEFVAEIGGTDRDPSDPVYRERWQQAQPETDDMLRGMIGVSAYLDYQLEAAHNSQNEQAGTH